MSNNWPSVYVAILRKQPAICPECGGTVSHEFFAKQDRLGFGILKCETCHEQFVLSRVRFPESVEDVKPMIHQVG